MIRRSMARWTLALVVPLASRIALYVNVYAFLQKLDPGTARRWGKDLAINLGTLRGLEWFLPYLLMAELRDAARRQDIETTSLAAPYYLGQAGLLLGSVATWFLMRAFSGFGGWPWAFAPVLVSLWVASAALEAHCFLTPMNAIVEALDARGLGSAPSLEAGQGVAEGS